MKIIYSIRAGLLIVLMYLLSKVYSPLGFGWGATSLYYFLDFLNFLFYYLAFEIGVNIVRSVIGK